MNKKQKKEFNKLEIDKKAEFLHTAIIDNISGTMAKEIAKAMIAGMELEREQIYRKYVEPLDSQSDTISSDEWEIEVEKLLSYIRMEHLKYQQKQIKNIQDGEKNEI